ncbi:MAG: SDR family NAD(P)-dependent oxidoreductase [Gammaproteobacteria bacterium]|nr:SDR family NAD(P)-dependent oxidoreductase [Gammaproteobacteria bacterium]MXY51568.1 SDR family NAD(P)-dependent oxidoreductase [Gammaproteobacteria bacterium]MYB37435.1 SDR family NAD(P)-dependent oxidoreductase [Gammaproteobacteria bacterium]
MSEFEGKVAIITGAGGGIGRCHAIEFAKRGAQVVVNDLGGSVDGTGAGDAADAVVEEIRAMGGDAVANKASVADRDGAKSIAADAINAFGRIDILVNNAGILRDRTFKNMTLDEFDLVMDVHLTGTAYVTHAVWPHMYEQRYGRIVFTSSGSGIFGNFGQANYGAAKMGMLGLANVLALEGANRNVRVNCLGPGAATRMTNTVPGRDEDLDHVDPLRDPALVSPAVLFMCSEDAPNGAVIHASGGNYSRSEVWVNDAVELGAGATYEDLTPHIDQLMDMSAAHPRAPRAPRPRQ